VAFAVEAIGARTVAMTEVIDATTADSGVFGR
jgi:hypothetical protein